MKIALLSDQYPPRLGGIEMQVHDLAGELQAAGHIVHVITPARGPESMDGIKVHRLDVPLAPFDIPYTRRTFRLVREILEREKFDVVHAHSGVLSPFAFGATYISQKAGFPTTITSHCIWSHTDQIFRLINRAVHWSDWPVVLSGVSDIAASEIRNVIPVAQRPYVMVLPNGIDHTKWEIEHRLHDPREITLISVMRLARRKRPRALVKMVRRVRAELGSDYSVRLVLVGEGNQRRLLESMIDKFGMHQAVELTGRLTRDEIKQRFADADIFVAPGNLESFGIAALEARCAGLPVVAKRRAGISEFVADGVEGLLADSDRAMEHAIVRLIRDAELRTKIAEHNAVTPPVSEWGSVVERNLEAYAIAIDRMQRALARPAD
jgi:glycogen(starch) synthase